MLQIKFNQYFKLIVDLYRPLPEIDERLIACGFTFTKKVLNLNNGRTEYVIETTPKHMAKIDEILNTSN